MRICITGVAGFIGSNLADRLIADGHEVWGFDNFETGAKKNLNPELDFREADIALGKWFMPLTERADLIIHCAASYRDPDNWQLDLTTNIVGATSVASAARDWDARVIYFQTVLPPISSYAISKIAAEHYLRLSGVPLTVFRLAAVYGPRNLSGAIPTFYRQVAAGETCTVVEDATRDFVFIEDLVERVLRCISNPDGPVTRDGTYDVRTGCETPIRDIPLLIGEILDIEPIVNLVPRREDDVAHYEMNGTPRVGTPFSEGLRKVVEWYEQNGVTDTHTHLRIGEKNAS